MHHFESWEHGWHYFPVTLLIVMLLIMAICFFCVYRKRRIFFNSRWFSQNWDRDWFAACYKNRTRESAIEMLKKRYVRGEINKEKFEQMKGDISEVK